MIRRVLLGVVLLFVSWLVVLMLVGVLGSSNLLYGDAHQYGTVRVPGSGNVTLPAGDVNVAMAMDVVGRGNETPDLPIPRGLSFAATQSSSEGADPTTTDAVGASGNAASAGVNSQRKLWVMHVRHPGEYIITTHGSLAALGVNGQLWFGHDPPIPGSKVPLVALIITLVGWAGWLAFGRLRGRPSTT